LFLEKPEILPLTEEVKHKAVGFRRKTNKKLPDSILPQAPLLLTQPYHPD
jgi:hypothetical protein